MGRKSKKRRGGGGFKCACTADSLCRIGENVLCWAWLLSCVRLFVTPWTIDHQAPMSMGILQARILEWVAMPSYRASFQSMDQTQVSHMAGRFFIIYATREAQEYWKGQPIPLPFSSGSSRTRNQSRVSCIAGGFFTS